MGNHFLGPGVFSAVRACFEVKVMAATATLIFFVLLALPITTFQQDTVGLQSKSVADVLVDGPPRYVLERAKTEGYLATIILLFPKLGKRVPLDVHEGETADIIAATFFRHYSLSFGPQYIPVHNAIASVLKHEAEPADLSRSKVVPSDDPPHPYLAEADKAKRVFLTTSLKLLDGKYLDNIEVGESEWPESALRRWEEDLCAHPTQSISTHRGDSAKCDRQLSAAQRKEALEKLSIVVADALIHDDSSFRRPRGANATMQALFPSSKMPPSPLEAPLPVDPGPGWFSRERRSSDSSRESELDDEAAAQRELFLLQHPSTCSDRRVVVARMDGAIWGLAVNVHYLTLLLSFCWRHNRTLVTADPDHWNYAGGWCTSGWTCFFEPLGRCSEAEVWEPYTSDIRDDIQFDYRNYLYQVDTSSARALYFSNVDGPWLGVLNSAEYAAFVPERFKHRGLLWWRSQLASFVFRPRAFVSDYIAERQQSIAWHEAIVGLHVRHGDKSWDIAHQGSYMGGLAPYLAKADAQCDRIASATYPRGPRHVPCSEPAAARKRYFLSTDDAAVLSEAASRGLSATWDALEARFNGTHVYSPTGVSEKRWPGFPGNDPAVDTLRYTLDSIKSIVLLAEARVFVGTVTSCFSRLVFQLRVAARKSELDAGDWWTVDADPRHGPGWFVDP